MEEGKIAVFDLEIDTLNYYSSPIMAIFYASDSLDIYL
jgi:hypothetical protein